MFFEQESMKGLTEEGQLSAHFYHGFGSVMYTLRDNQHLEGQWVSERRPGKSGNSHAGG